MSYATLPNNAQQIPAPPSSVTGQQLQLKTMRSVFHDVATQVENARNVNQRLRDILGGFRGELPPAANTAAPEPKNGGLLGDYQAHVAMLSSIQIDTHRLLDELEQHI